MKKYSVIILFLAFVLLVTGCEKKNTIESGGEKVSVSGMEHKHCTRGAVADADIDVSLEYDIYYKGENIQILHAVEKVITSDEDSLTTYEDAYKKIYDNYKGLKYYDAKVVRGDTTVTSDVTINYAKIDIEKLIAIEGEEDNVFENGEAKLQKWLALADKFGTKCEDVSDSED